MISILVYGRNDSYGYNLHKRSALGLNCMAELLTDPKDEILFVDYNTPNDLPTFPEAIRDTLTKTARQKLRVLRVRSYIHERFANRTPLSVLEAIARNVGVRRSNEDNRWLLSTNADMIFVPQMDQSLSEIVCDLPTGYYSIPRFELPEALWEVAFDRRAPRSVIEQCRRWGWDAHLNEIVHGIYPVKFDAPGDFQLIERNDLFEIHGFNEDMLLGWHVDSNIAKRLSLLHGKIGDLSDLIFGYHCDHTRQPTPKHAKSLVRDDIVDFVDKVSTAALPAQREVWGCPNDNVEEISLMHSPGDIYLQSLRKVLAPAMECVAESSYTSQTYDKVKYDPHHVLPYLIDIFVNAPRSWTLGWFGCHAAMFKLFSDMWSRLAFIGPILITGEDRRYLDIQNCAAPYETRDVQDICESADALIFDFANVDGTSEHKPGDAISKSIFSRLVNAFHTLHRVEQRRFHEGFAARHIIGVNAIHNRFEKLFGFYVNYAASPFSSRLRHGFFIPSVQAFPAFMSWLPLMSVGSAGVRKGDSVYTRNGAAGHVVYGPHAYLVGGDYHATFKLRASRLQSLLHRHDRVAAVEVVSGDDVLAHRYLIGQDLMRSAHSISFTVPSGGELDIEARVWTDGKTQFAVDAVDVERNAQSTDNRRS